MKINEDTFTRANWKIVVQYPTDCPAAEPKIFWAKKYLGGKLIEKTKSFDRVDQWMDEIGIGNRPILVDAEDQAEETSS